jgi:hypothetical protein
VGAGRSCYVSAREPKTFAARPATLTNTLANGSCLGSFQAGTGHPGRQMRCRKNKTHDVSEKEDVTAGQKRVMVLLLMVMRVSKTPQRVVPSACSTGSCTLKAGPAEGLHVCVQRSSPLSVSTEA